MFLKKKEASVVLYANGDCTIKGSVIDIAKIYIGCRQVLQDKGCDFDKLHEMQGCVTKVSEEALRR